MTIQATHAPAPGHYAHLASTGLTDRVVLDYHNGHPSVLILEIDETPVLAWLLLGHGGLAELWIYVPLTSEEAESLTDDPPVLLVDWLARRVGRDVFLGLAEDGILVFTTSWRVPDASPSRLPADAINFAVGELLQAIQSAEALSKDTRRSLSDSKPKFRKLADAL